MKSNRSICLCSLTKFGRKCLLKLSCPTYACRNHGQCIPNQFHFHQTYTCLCSKEYFGSNCPYLKSKFDLTLNFNEIPSYLIAYFLTINDHSSPQWTISVEKLTLFQCRIIFHFSIVYQQDNVRPSVSHNPRL